MLGAGAALAVAVAAWPESVIGVTYDDAFYYLEIGRRFAAGEGSTFDGLRPTNGYHPLWMLVCAALCAVALEGAAAARAALVIQAPMVAGGAALALAGLAWRRPAPDAPAPADIGAAAVVAALWLLVPALTRTQLNGLESGLVGVTHGAVLLAMLRSPRALHEAPLALRIGLGAALVGAFLARTDAALLVPILAAFAVPHAARAPVRVAVGLLPALGPPTAAVVAFLALNQAWFDTPMQVSGSLKRVPPGPIGVGILVAAAAFVGLAALAGARGWPRGLPQVARVLDRGGPYLGFLAAITAYYTGLQTFARVWYFAPAVSFGLVLAVALTLDLAAQAQRERPTAAPWRAVAPAVGVLAAPLLVAIPLTGAPLLRDEALAIRRADIAAARWLDAHLPADARVGSWDAGVIGYHAEVRVVNLDGVVNDVGWLRALRSGTTADRLRADEIRFYANHSLFEDGACTSVLDALARLDPEAARRAVVVAHWPYTQAASLNGGPYRVHRMATCVIDTAPGTPARVPGPVQ